MIKTILYQRSWLLSLFNPKKCRFTAINESKKFHLLYAVLFFPVLSSGAIGTPHNLTIMSTLRKNAIVGYPLWKHCMNRLLLKVLHTFSWNLTSATSVLFLGDGYKFVCNKVIFTVWNVICIEGVQAFPPFPLGEVPKKELYETVPECLLFKGQATLQT